MTPAFTKRFSNKRNYRLVVILPTRYANRAGKLIFRYNGEQPKCTPNVYLGYFFELFEARSPLEHNRPRHDALSIMLLLYETEVLDIPLVDGIGQPDIDSQESRVHFVSLTYRERKQKRRKKKDYEENG